MNPISQISPVSDAEAARLVQAATMAALADDIVRVGARCPPACALRLPRRGQARRAPPGHGAATDGCS